MWSPNAWMMVLWGPDRRSPSPLPLNSPFSSVWVRNGRLFWVAAVHTSVALRSAQKTFVEELNSKWVSLSFSTCNQPLPPPHSKDQRCSGPVRRRPSQHREAMRARRDLRDCAHHDGAKAGTLMEGESWDFWGLWLVRDHLTGETSSSSWAHSATCCLWSELQITARLC